VKIALAYAIGRRSLSAFDEILVRGIVIGSTDGALSYVGRASVPSTSVGGAAHVHALREQTHADLLTVYIVLFRELDESMPVYQVVVGRLRP